MKHLNDLRQEIDAIDAQLAALLRQRLQAARGVAEYKAAHALPIYQSGREEEILNAFAANFPPEEAPFARAFLKNTIRQSREYQYYLNRTVPEETHTAQPPSVVCYPGVPGSHSGIAASALYPDAPQRACAGFEAVFAAIREDPSAIGVLPLDNSTAGTVGDVYDLLVHNELFIVRATTRAISHCLLAPPGALLADIKHVYSHPQALAQCADYLKSRGFHAREASNTATAAQYVAGLSDPTTAALASRETAALYHLDVLEENVNDERSNQTRFICISQTPAPTAQANRLSLAFDLPNTPGALSDILAIFSDSCVNLTKILSRPIPERPWEYTFYLDCEYTPRSPALQGVFTHLRAELPAMKLLGIYHEEELQCS